MFLSLIMYQNKFFSGTTGFFKYWFIIKISIFFSTASDVTCKKLTENSITPTVAKIKKEI